jgi:hypothetical protein
MKNYLNSRLEMSIPSYHILIIFSHYLRNITVAQVTLLELQQSHYVAEAQMTLLELQQSLYITLVSRSDKVTGTKK